MAVRSPLRMDSGSSPHVRGARGQGCPLSGIDGIIPACAGSTGGTTHHRQSTGDHPRMCGENEPSGHGHTHLLGSSPHVRGARGRRCGSGVRLGIIPACAGSTDCAQMACRMSRDHPRMCGEHSRACIMTPKPQGSSPHVRGALNRAAVDGSHRGIIPACAGSTGMIFVSADCNWDHPRMCGEHIVRGVCLRVLCGSSPHVRGAHFENSIIPRKRKDNWLFFIQFRFENFLAFRYLLALLHPFLGVPTKDPSFASLGRLINCNPSQSTGDQSAPYTLKAICCSFLAE